MPIRPDDLVPLNEPYDYDVELFSRPREALTRWKQETIAEVRQAYEEDQLKRHHVETFYRDNPDLDKHRSVVRGVAMDLLDQGWNQVGLEHAPAYMKEVAKRARQQIGGGWVDDDHDGREDTMSDIIRGMQRRGGAAHVESRINKTRGDRD